MHEPELAAMLAAAARGEVEPFEQLVRLHERQVYRWALVLAADGDDADDLAQAVWIKVHRSLGTFRGEAKFTTWLYRITWNIGEERRRTGARRNEALEGQGPAEQQIGPQHVDIDAERLVQLVKEYLQGLPPRQRAVLALADFEGVPAAEIAERLEIPEVTVRTNLLKARRAIRHRLLQSEPRLVEEFRS